MLSGNGIQGNFKGLPFIDKKIVKHESSAYDGGTLNAHGDFDGTGNPYTIFNVSGVVIVETFFGVCNTNLVGAATLDVGTVDDDDIFSPSQFADTSTWDAGEIWDGTGVDSSAGGLKSLLGAAIRRGVILDGDVTNQSAIIETLAAANVTAGQVDWYCVWYPLEAGASITSA
jgi:hypothetical protein